MVLEQWTVEEQFFLRNCPQALIALRSHMHDLFAHYLRASLGRGSVPINQFSRSYHHPSPLFTCEISAPQQKQPHRSCGRVQVSDKTLS